LAKIKILGKNQNSWQKSKFLAKIIIIGKNNNFGKNHNF